MSECRQKLIDAFLKKAKKPIADRIPKNEKQARARFYCHKLTKSVCSMSGVDCARRHANAAVRWSGSGITYGAEYFNVASDRNDQTCATCETGKARAEILGIVSKRRARKPRPKYGKALSNAIKIEPHQVAERLGRPYFNTADLRAAFRWSENTIKKWMIHYSDGKKIERGPRVGLFFRWLIL